MVRDQVEKYEVLEDALRESEAREKELSETVEQQAKVIKTLQPAVKKG